MRVDPVHSFEGGELDLFSSAPGFVGVDQFGLVGGFARLSEGVIGVAAGSDRPEGVQRQLGGHPGRGTLHTLDLAPRGDLTELLSEDPRAHAVAVSTFTLAEVLTGRAPVKPRDGWQVPSMSDVTAVVQPHCHQYSVMGYTADRDLLARAGATVTEASGCCGLAGNWGYENGHYDVSAKIAENSLLPALREAGLTGGDAPEDVVYLADGVSCRTQADAFVGVEGLHLAQVLAARLER